ncbi:His Kinase A (phospho-acceptor) domain-containing protein [Marivirga sericea]|uniref:histidine kinase n=1 Tax=Marivirga sericea TaxID=1028 RepID=A0A1X7KYA4_9BACT|nr:ATP-binding protein [Marivirga sericea]SMG46173.1 His Kinase A (phospho-acceptor) domain-containing protein [Marivirga sericea]
MKIQSAVLLFLGVTLLLHSQLSAQSLSWSEAQKQRTATLDLHWYISKPFIYKSRTGKPEGLEVEILESFQAYVKDNYQVDLTLNWVESKSFHYIFNEIARTTKPNSMGVSAFSITDERRKKVNFTNPYLTDVAVLVSSKGTPIVRTLGEINKMMQDMTAVTIRGTTYEQFLLNLRKQLNTDFDILYIGSDKNILDEISKTDDRFGFIDLPIYLMLIKTGGTLTRQNFFTIKGNGYGFITPSKSDWTTIFNEFLSEPKTTMKLATITSKYMGPELYNFIDGLYSENNLGASILTKEKEIQLQQLRKTNLLLEKEKNSRSTFIIITLVSIILLGIIIALFYREQKISKLLSKKNKQIEQQQKSIQSKNEKLHNRNLQLTGLNEEKNNLVKILAHDLRSPINQITGLLDILKLSHSHFSKDEEKIIHQVQDSAQRLNQMISKILDFDALEGNRMKVITEEIEVKELLQTVEKELQVIASKKNTTVHYKTDRNLRFKSDHLFLTQILENIIVNAIKFSDPGSKISVNAKIEKDKIIFSIKDDGPGLTEEDKALIFKKFQKLSAKPTGGENSTGLGLSIVKKYIDLLDGEVWVESEKGQGSTFFVALPIE